MTETPSEGDLVRQVARLTRRIDQLENILSSAEAMRDTNARLLDRVMQDLDRERARSEDLLRNILPQPIIDRLNAGERLIADRYDDVTVLFSDLVDFTHISAEMLVSSVVSSLNSMFSAFDAACTRLGVEKIKTIGDAYMVAGGVPLPRNDHAEAIADTALAMGPELARCAAAAGVPLQVRIGIDTGTAVAGVIGRSKFIYDLWGDTVNTASRMESHAEAGTIQVTARVEERLRESFDVRPRGTIDVKGKGPMECFVLAGRSG